MAEDADTGADLLRFQTLGPLRVLGNGQALPLGPPLQRALLAALVVDAPSTVSVPVLMERLWIGEPPDTAVKSIQKYVSNLRRVLGAERIESNGGYRLALKGVEVDAVVFEQALVSGQDERPELRLARLESAFGLWRGEPYADLPEPMFLEPVRARLSEVRLAIIEERLALLADLGRLEQVATETGELVELHPLRERLWQHRMSALAGLGRPAEALGEFQRLRQHLGEQLGLAPSPETSALEERILLQDPALGPRPATSGNIPAPGASIVGRDSDIERVGELLKESRLVTVVGAGGVGKTTLALEVARRAAVRHSDGAWFIGLGPLTDPERVPGRTTEILGAGEFSSRDAGEALVDFLSRRRALVMLDNCEHVIEAVAGMVQQVLRFASGVTVLATSRQPLGLAGEVVFTLDALPYPPSTGSEPATLEYPAVRLLLTRADDAGAPLGPVETLTPHLAEITRLLDGIPLAIELAAARLRALSAKELARRLRERLPDLASGRRDLPERQRTLEAAIDWSFQLLTPDEQKVLTWLSVFRGGFTLDAAEEVCGSPGLDVLSMISSLIDQSLVSVAPQTDGTTRYVILHVIRLFAQEKLGDETSGVAGRHANYFLGLAEDAEVRQTRIDPRRFPIFAADHENLRVALSHFLDTGMSEAALRLATSLGTYWGETGALSEAQTWLTKSLEAAPAAPAGVRARALLALSAAHQPSSSEKALGTAESALAESRKTIDHLLVAEALCSVGRVRAARNERDLAIPLIEEALATFVEAEDKWGIARCHESLGVAHRGAPDRELEYYRTAVELYREIDADQDLASTLHSMAYRSLIPSDRLAEARHALEESLALYTRLGLRHGILHAQTGLGQLSRLEGHIDEAWPILTESLEGMRDVGDRRCTVRILTALARMALVRDDHRQALRLLEEGLTVSGHLDQGLSSDVHELIDALALVARREGDHELAGKWFGAAESTRLRQGLLRTPPDQIEITRTLQELEQEVGAEQLRSLLDQGTHLSLDEITRELSHLVRVAPTS